MNFIKNNLANAFTLGNLFSGSIGVINLVDGNYKVAAVCIIISLVLDFLDGFVARALKANSNLGAIGFSSRHGKLRTFAWCNDV